MRCDNALQPLSYPSASDRTSDRTYLEQNILLNNPLSYHHIIYNILFFSYPIIPSVIRFPKFGTKHGIEHFSSSYHHPILPNLT